MDNIQPTFEINFLRKRKKDLSAIEKTDKKYAIWMGYLVGSLFFVFVFLFGVNFFFVTRINRVKADMKRTQSAIAEQKHIEEQYLTLAEKMNFISQVLEDRTEKRQAIKFFTEKFSTETTTLRELTYEAGTLTFQLSSTTVFDMQEAVQFLTSTEVSSLYPAVTISDISRGNEGEYTMQVAVSVTSSSTTPESSTLNTNPNDIEIIE